MLSVHSREIESLCEWLKMATEDLDETEDALRIEEFVPLPQEADMAEIGGPNFQAHSSVDVGVSIRLQKRKNKRTQTKEKKKRVRLPFSRRRGDPHSYKISSGSSSAEAES